jgi:putative endonuclease
MKKRNYYVYIVTNFTNTTFYIGVTNNLERRILEHKEELADGFTKTYHLNKLVYYEECSDINEAIAREKQLKNWHRGWKLNLIRSMNPKLLDLFSLEDAEINSA